MRDARLLALAGVLLATLLAGRAVAEEPAARGAGRVAVSTVAGTVDEGVREGRLALTTAAGALVLRLDRDTAIFLPDRVGTVRDLRPGAQVRAACAAAPGPGERLAYWIEVGAPAHGSGRDEAPPEQAEPVALPAPPSARRAAPPPAATAGRPAPEPGAPGGPGPGEPVPAGPPSPEPNPGAQPARPGGAGPTPPAGPLRGP